MKVFNLVGGMILFASLFSACSGQNPMTVLCSIDWFMVTVHPFMLNNDVYVHFYELHLGLGCPVNHVQPHFYQFTYRVTECGIRIKAISQDMVIYSTEIHYASKGTSSKYVIPVSCAAPQRSPWLTLPSPMRTPGDSTAAAKNDDRCPGVFSLSQSSQSPNCDCPPWVFNEEHTPASHHQAEAQETHAARASYFLDVSEDWCLPSDDLTESM